MSGGAGQAVAIEEFFLPTGPLPTVAGSSAYFDNDDLDVGSLNQNEQIDILQGLFRDMSIRPTNIIYHFSKLYCFVLALTPSAVNDYECGAPSGESQRDATSQTNINTNIHVSKEARVVLAERLSAGLRELNKAIARFLAARGRAVAGVGDAAGTRYGSAEIEAAGKTLRSSVRMYCFCLCHVLSSRCAKTGDDGDVEVGTGAATGTRRRSKRQNTASSSSAEEDASGIHTAAREMALAALGEVMAPELSGLWAKTHDMEEHSTSDDNQTTIHRVGAVDLALAQLLLKTCTSMLSQPVNITLSSAGGIAIETELPYHYYINQNNFNGVHEEQGDGAGRSVGPVPPPIVPLTLSDDNNPVAIALLHLLTLVIHRYVLAFIEERGVALGHLIAAPQADVGRPDNTRTSDDLSRVKEDGSANVATGPVYSVHQSALLDTLVNSLTDAMLRGANCVNSGGISRFLARLLAAVDLSGYGVGAAATVTAALGRAGGALDTSGSQVTVNRSTISDNRILLQCWPQLFIGRFMIALYNIAFEDVCSSGQPAGRGGPRGADSSGDTAAARVLALLLEEAARCRLSLMSVFIDYIVNPLVFCPSMEMRKAALTVLSVLLPSTDQSGAPAGSGANAVMVTGLAALPRLVRQLVATWPEGPEGENFGSEAGPLPSWSASLPSPLTPCSMVRQHVFKLLYLALRDVNPFVRLHVVKVWGSVLEGQSLIGGAADGNKNQLPQRTLARSYCLLLLQEVLGRLNDRHYLVRRSAFVLLRIIIKQRWYGGMLSAARLRQRRRHLIQAAQEAYDQIIATEKSGDASGRAVGANAESLETGCYQYLPFQHYLQVRRANATSIDEAVFAGDGGAGPAYIPGDSSQEGDSILEYDYKAIKLTSPTEANGTSSPIFGSCADNTAFADPALSETAPPSLVQALSASVSKILFLDEAYTFAALLSMAVQQAQQLIHQGSANSNPTSAGANSNNTSVFDMVEGIHFIIACANCSVDGTIEAVFFVMSLVQHQSGQVSEAVLKGFMDLFYYIPITPGDIDGINNQDAALTGSHTAANSSSSDGGGVPQTTINLMRVQRLMFYLLLASEKDVASMEEIIRVITNNANASSSSPSGNAAVPGGNTLTLPATVIAALLPPQGLLGEPFLDTVMHIVMNISDADAARNAIVSALAESIQSLRPLPDASDDSRHRGHDDYVVGWAASPIKARMGRNGAGSTASVAAPAPITARQVQTAAMQLYAMLAFAAPNDVARRRSVLVSLLDTNPQQPSNNLFLSYIFSALSCESRSSRFMPIEVVSHGDVPGAGLLITHPIVARALHHLCRPTRSFGTWYKLAQQAVGYLHCCCQAALAPSLLLLPCKHLLRELRQEAFSRAQARGFDSATVSRQLAMDDTPAPTYVSADDVDLQDLIVNYPRLYDPIRLAQLFILVALSCIKNVVSIDDSERAQMRALEEAAPASGTTNAGSEVDVMHKELGLAGAAHRRFAVQEACLRLKRAMVGEADAESGEVEARGCTGVAQDTTIWAQLGQLAAAYLEAVPGPSVAWHPVEQGGFAPFDPDCPLPPQIQEIRIAAVQCLLHLCIVSDTYCSQRAPLLLGLLSRRYPREDGSGCWEEPWPVKINIIIGIGDLLCLYPNVMEPYLEQSTATSDKDNASSHPGSRQPGFFSLLYHKIPSVRATTIQICTFLIINELLKIKSDLYLIVNCLADPVPSISIAAMQFLYYYANKQKKNISNIIPPLLPLLVASRDNGPEAGNDPAAPADDPITAIIIKAMLVLMSFMEGEKASLALMVRLCERYPRYVATEDRRGRRNNTSYSYYNNYNNDSYEGDDVESDTEEGIRRTKAPETGRAGQTISLSGYQTRQLALVITTIISRIPFLTNEKVLRRLAGQGCYRLYKPWLKDPSIYQLFADIAARAKGTGLREGRERDRARERVVAERKDKAVIEEWELMMMRDGPTRPGEEGRAETTEGTNAGELAPPPSAVVADRAAPEGPAHADNDNIDDDRPGRPQPRPQSSKDKGRGRVKKQQKRNKRKRARPSSDDDSGEESSYDSSSGHAS